MQDKNYFYLCERLIITDSLLCPWVEKVLTFSVKSTHLIWTFPLAPPVSVLTEFDSTMGTFFNPNMFT